MKFWLIALLVVCSFADADTLIHDPSFRNGVTVAAVMPDITGHVKHARIEGILKPATAVDAPVWMLAQWGSGASILSQAATACDEGLVCRHVMSGDREQKAVVIGDGRAFDLQLRSDGLVEFSGRTPRDTPYLVKGEMWPHWLVSQPVRARAIADYQSLTLSFEARLDVDDAQRQTGYDHSIHAARFMVALNVKNRFTHDFLWVMLPVYDDRWPASQYGCQKCLRGVDDEPACSVPTTIDAPGQWQCPRDAVESDAGQVLGTSRMLFRLPSSAFVNRPLKAGDWVRHTVDLKPWLLEALKAATGQGEAGFLYQPEDFRLATISIGWELSGLNRVSLSLRDLSLQGVRR